MIEDLSGKNKVEDMEEEMNDQTLGAGNKIKKVRSKCARKKTSSVHRQCPQILHLKIAVRLMSNLFQCASKLCFLGHFLSLLTK